MSNIDKQSQAPQMASSRPKPAVASLTCYSYRHVAGKSRAAKSFAFT